MNLRKDHYHKLSKYFSRTIWNKNIVVNSIMPFLKYSNFFIFPKFCKNVKTFSDGCLGSRNDEERSEMRYVMRIAESVNHQIFERTLHFQVFLEVFLFECLFTSLIEFHVLKYVVFGGLWVSLMCLFRNKHVDLKRKKIYKICIHNIKG